MFPVSLGRRALILGCAVLMAVAMVSPAAAQTGVLKGKVVDAKGVPVEACEGHHPAHGWDPAHLRGEERQEG